MKYHAKLDNINIENENIKSIDINIFNETKNNYINDQNRIEVIINGEIYTKDNGSYKNNVPVKEILSIKKKYFDANISLDNISYKIPKLYIHKFIQRYIGAEANYTIVLLQRFLGKEEEMMVDIKDDNKA